MVKHRHIVPNDLEWEGNTFNEYKPITNIAWVRTQLSNLQKGCTRLAAASDKVYQLLAQGQWFSTTTTGRHDTVFEFTGQKTSKLEYLYRFY